MPIRWNPVDEAARRAHSQLELVVADLRNSRRNAGLSQAAVANALGISRQLLCAFEGTVIIPSPIQLARWGAVVGLDVTVRAYSAGAPLRDAGQLRLLARFRVMIGDEWMWRTEVPVSSDPRDRRAFDAVLERLERRVAVEAIGRLMDAQAQVRATQLKQQVSGIDRMVLALADTRHNRRATIDAQPTLAPVFPLPPREVLAALRAGELPALNGLILV